MQGGLLGQVVLANLHPQIREALAQLKVGEITGPIQFEQGLAFFQRTTLMHYITALKWMKAAKYPQALEALAKDLALNPDRLHSLILQAHALQHLQRLPEAQAVYRHLLQREPNYGPAYNNLGTLLDQQGRYQDAVRMFEKALTLTPHQDVTFYNLAWLYAARLGQAAKALPYIQQAAALQPALPHYHALLADITRQLGRTTEAQAALTQAAQLAPHHSPYQQRLAEPTPSKAAPPLEPPPGLISPDVAAVLGSALLALTSAVLPSAPASAETRSVVSVAAEGSLASLPALPPQSRAARTPWASLSDASLKPASSATTDNLRASPSTASTQAQATKMSRTERPASRLRIKVVTRPGGEQASQTVIRLLEEHGFPVTRRYQEDQPWQGVRLYYRAHARDAARKMEAILEPHPELHEFKWPSQFDVILLVGASQSP